MACEYVLSSQDFSIPVCRYPRSGVAFTTVSPSSSSKILSTPCVDGCCGPMLRTIVFAVPTAVSTVVMACCSSCKVPPRSVRLDTPPPDNPCARDGLPNHLEVRCAANPDGPKNECQRDQKLPVLASWRPARQAPANRQPDRPRRATPAISLFPAAEWKPSDSSFRIAARPENRPRKWRRDEGCTAGWDCPRKVVPWLGGGCAATR